MRVGEAAKRLDVSKSTVYGLIAAGKLKCCRVGLGRGAIRIMDAHLAEFLSGAEPVVAPPVSAPSYRPKHVRARA